MTPEQTTEHDEKLAADTAGAPEAAGQVSAAAAQSAENAVDDGPEHVPGNAWITMGLFAAFVIAFGTCASTFMFN